MPDEPPHPLLELFADLMRDGADALSDDRAVAGAGRTYRGHSGGYSAREIAERTAGYIARIKSDPTQLSRLVIETSRNGSIVGLSHAQKKEILYSATAVFEYGVRREFTSRPMQIAERQARRVLPPNLLGQFDIVKSTLTPGSAPKDIDLVFQCLDMLMGFSLDGAIHESVLKMEKSQVGRDFLNICDQLVSSVSPAILEVPSDDRPFEVFNQLGAETDSEFVTAGLRTINDNAPQWNVLPAQAARDNWAWLVPLTKTSRLSIGHISFAAIERTQPLGRPLGVPFSQGCHRDEHGRIHFDQEPSLWTPNIADPDLEANAPFVEAVLLGEPTVHCPASKSVGDEDPLTKTTWNAGIDTLIHAGFWQPDRALTLPISLVR